MPTTQVQWRRGTQAQNNSFIGATGEITIDYENHRIIVHDNTTMGGWTGAKLIDLNNQNITNAVYITGTQGISGNKTFYTDLDGGKSIDVYNRQLLTSSAPSVDWFLRTLYDSTSSPVLTWGGYLLIDSNNFNSLQWNSRIGYHANGNPTLDWNNQTLYDSSVFGRQSIDWNGRKLKDTSNNSSIDWQGYLLYDVSAFKSIDWNNRQLLKNDGITISLDWRNAILSGNWSINSGLFNNSISIQPKSTGLSFTLSDKPFYINNSTGLVTWTLPRISSCTGRLFFLKNIGNVITLTGQSNDKIFSSQPVLNYTIYSGESWQVANDGNFWQIL